MTRQCKTEALAAMHEAAQDLFDANLILKKGMRELDEMSFTPNASITPAEGQRPPKPPAANRKLT